MRKKKYIVFGVMVILIFFCTVSSCKLNGQPGGGTYENEWGVLPIRSQEEYNNGETGGEGFQHPHSIAQCRTVPDVIYWAEDIAQVWKSVDAGDTWHKVRGEGFMVKRSQSIEVDPVNPDMVLVIGENHSNVDVTWAQEFVGLYKTEDGGVTWDHVLHAPNAIFRSYQHNIAYDPTSITASGATMWYAAFFPGENLYRSEDSGETWEMVSSLAAHSSIYCLSVHHIDGSIFLASNNGFYKSTNGGTSFLNTGNLPAGEVSSIAVDEVNDYVYAVVKGTGLYRSIDRGESFSLVRSDDALFVFINPGYPDKIYLVRTSSNVIVSSDSGLSWNTNVTVHPPEGLDRYWKNQIYGDFSGIAPHPGNPDEAVAYCNANFYKTTDGGDEFYNSSTLFTGAAWSFYNYAASFDKENPRRFFFFCNDFCLLRTENGGDWFDRVRPEGLGVWPGSYAGAVQPVADSNILIANLGDYFNTILIRSTNGGDNWSVASNEHGYNYFVEFHTNNTDYVYAGNQISTNAGASFSPVSYLVNNDAEMIGMCRSEPDTVYAINLAYGASNRNRVIYRSDNAGITWRVYHGPDSWHFGHVDSKPIFATHPSNPDIVYAKCQSNGELGKYNGVRWISLGVLDFAGGENIGNYVRAVAIDPRHPEIMYAGTAYCGRSFIYRSTDSGATWEDITHNHPMVGTWAITVHPLTGDLMHGTCFGTWVFPPPYNSPYSLINKCEIYGN